MAPSHDWNNGPSCQTSLSSPWLSASDSQMTLSLDSAKPLGKHPSRPSSRRKSTPLSMGLNGAMRLGGRYWGLIWLVPFWLLLLVVLPSKHLKLDAPHESQRDMWQREGSSVRQRGRFLLGRQGVFERFGFTRDAIAALPREHVEQMRGSYTQAHAQGATRVLLIHVQHGLSNRLRAYLSAKAFAIATGRHLRLVWVPDQHCQTHFTDLFESPEDVIDHFEPGEVAGSNFVTYDYMDPHRKYQLIEDGPQNIYVSSAYLLNTTYGFEDVDLSSVFTALWPVKEIRSVLQQFRSSEFPEFAPDWWPCMSYVSVHMRQGTPPIGEHNAEDLEQYSPAVRSTLYMARTQMSATVHFIYGLRSILAKKPALKVFVASDTPESVRELEREFGDRVFHLKHPESCSAKVRDVACQRAALTDLLMLAHSSHPTILGSYWSSFTEVAALLKNKRVLRASIDFEAPGFAPLVCDPDRKQQARVLEGVSICTALTPSRANLLTQSLPTWLAAEGVLEVIVVDYKPGNDTRLAETVAAFKDPRVKYVKVEGSGRFDITRASNFAVRHSRGSRIAKLDSDNKIRPKFFAMHPRAEGVYYAGNWKAARTENERHLNGVYLVDRKLWIKVNGFDERIVGYGHDDDNLHMRLSKLATRQNVDLNYISHIEHADSLREGIQYTDVSIVYNAALTERLPLWGNKDRNSGYDCSQLLDGSCDCTMTSPADDIQSGLSTEEQHRFLLDAFRQVVGYSADLPKEDLAKVDSIPWFEKQLQIHYLKGRREWVVVRPMGSCADRTDAIASGRQLAEKLGRPFRVVWLQESACRKRIPALFGADLDVVEEFFDWEVNYKFKEFDLTIGPDWILPSTSFPKKSLFILAGGPFGDSTFSPPTLEKARQALLPISPTPGHPTDPPLLIVDIPGSLPERLLLLARSILLAYKLNRRLVLVWDSVEVGGIDLHEVLNSPYLVLPPGDLSTGLPTTHLPVKDVQEIDLREIAQETRSHVRIRDGHKLDSVELDEVHWNTVIGLLDLTFPVKEAAYRQMVGNSFRGLVIDGDSACSNDGLMGAIQASLALSNVTGGSYFAAAAPPAVCARLRERGVLCTPTCHAGNSRDCHLSHLAMTMALAQSKGLFFTSWSDKSVDWILRRGLIPGKQLECGSDALDSFVPIFRPALSLSSTGKRELTETDAASCGKGKVHLIVQYPVLKSANSSGRQAEFAEAFRRNLNHPQIAGVHVLLESKRDGGVIRGAFLDPCQKLRFSFLGRRLMYNDSFAYANEHLAGQLCAIANGDISFASGLDTLSLEGHLAGGARALALSRHEETESDVCGRNMCYRYEHSETGFLSSDAFLFLSPVARSVVNNTGFGPQPGSENVVIWALKRGGLDVRNPCRSVRVFHHHCSGDRSSLPTDVKSWETDVEQDARVDMKVCGEQHCGDGYCKEGAEVLEDLEAPL